MDKILKEKKNVTWRKADEGTSEKLFRQTQKGLEGRTEHYYLTLHHCWH